MVAAHRMDDISEHKKTKLTRICIGPPNKSKMYLELFVLVAEFFEIRGWNLAVHHVLGITTHSPSNRSTVLSPLDPPVSSILVIEFAVLLTRSIISLRCRATIDIRGSPAATISAGPI